MKRSEEDKERPGKAIRGQQLARASVFTQPLRVLHPGLKTHTAFSEAASETFPQCTCGLLLGLKDMLNEASMRTSCEGMCQV